MLQAVLKSLTSSTLTQFNDVVFVYTHIAFRKNAILSSSRFWKSWLKRININYAVSVVHTMYSVAILDETNKTNEKFTVTPFKDGASLRYCAYILHISGYSGFLRNLPPNTTILCGKNRSKWGLSESKKKIGGNHAFSEIIELKFGKELPYILCILTLF